MERGDQAGLPEPSFEKASDSPRSMAIARLKQYCCDDPRLATLMGDVTGQEARELISQEAKTGEDPDALALVIGMGIPPFDSTSFDALAIDLLDEDLDPVALRVLLQRVGKPSFSENLPHSPRLGSEVFRNAGIPLRRKDDLRYLAAHIHACRRAGTCALEGRRFADAQCFTVENCMDSAALDQFILTRMMSDREAELTESFVRELACYSNC